MYVSIVSQPADLVVNTVSIPEVAEARKGLTVDWTVTNQGMGNTIVTSWTDQIYVSSNETFGDSDDRLLESFVRNGLLELGNSYSRREVVEIPFSLAGNYNLFVVTDTNNQVYESSDSNNFLTANSIFITRQTPDLQVTQVSSSSANGLTAEPVTVSWTVKNLGAGQTNASFWYDDVYLSEDTNLGDSNDIYLGRVRRTNALDVAGEYEVNATFTVPLSAVGDFYVIVRSDSDNQVLEEPLENNNHGVSASVITFNANPNPNPNLFSQPGQPPLTLPPEFSPDLVVTSVNAPNEAVSGQLFEVSWAVSNNRYDTGNRTWYDAVYLSRDQIFDRDSDTYLGAIARNNLGAGESYNATQSFRIPKGLAGPFYVFVATDSGNRINEPEGEFNNTAYDGSSMQVIIPPPADLVAGTITIPVNGIPGQTASLEYTIENQSSASALGQWTDSIYISADDQWDVNDPLFAQVQVFGPINGGQSYSKTVTAVLPGVATGDYHVIVRSDIRNALPESNEVNNLGVSLNQFEIDVEALELGVADTGTLGQGQAVYYRVDVAAGETLLLQLDSESETAANELYIRYGEMPSRTQFDVGFSEALSPDQEIVVSNTLAGTYYILAYGDNVSGEANYSIEAELLEFSLRKLGTTRGSNRGQVIITLKGAEFTPDTIATLIGVDGTERTASRLIWKDSTELWATFDLQGLETGLYDVQVEDGAEVGVLEDSFTVTSGAVGLLETQLILPSALRPGQQGVVTVNYANVGETDIVAPLLTLAVEDANLQLPNQRETDSDRSTVQFLAINSQGAAGILSPGTRGSFSALFKPTIADGNVQFSVSGLADTSITNWSSFQSETQPLNTSNEAWDLIWNNFMAKVGTTAEQYQIVLSENATYLSQMSEYTNDVNRLLAFELRQANNTPSYSLMSQELTSKIDALSATPELPLTFARQYRPSIDGRLTLGVFGYGWTHQWDTTAITDNEGNVTIFDAGDRRVFIKQADGTYQGQGSDFGRLTQEEGATFRLREKDGTVVSFRLDGKLDYVEDPNGNRIAATYTGDLLTGLIHLNGERFTLTYNTHGRINELIDQAGRTTTYEYDETGEHLLRVSGFDGTLNYTYDTRQGTASEHALRSITFPDGSTTFFDYDEQGRLIRQSGNEEAQSVIYTYDETGNVTITDATGASNTVSFLDKGTISQWQDPLQQVTQFRFDENGNLVQVIDADQTTSNFIYDERTNLIRSIDALGNDVEFTYDARFNALARTQIIDQDGFVVNYTYDALGQLTSLSDNNNSPYRSTLHRCSRQYLRLLQYCF